MKAVATQYDFILKTTLSKLTRSITMLPIDIRFVTTKKKLYFGQ